MELTVFLPYHSRYSFIDKLVKEEARIKNYSNVEFQKASAKTYQIIVYVTTDHIVHVLSSSDVCNGKVLMALKKLFA